MCICSTPKFFAKIPSVISLFYGFALTPSTTFDGTVKILTFFVATTPNAAECYGRWFNTIDVRKSP